jgi:hypothetical protein
MTLNNCATVSKPSHNRFANKSSSAGLRQIARRLHSAAVSSDHFSQRKPKAAVHQISCRLGFRASWNQHRILIHACPQTGLAQPYESKRTRVSSFDRSVILTPLLCTLSQTAPFYDFSLLCMSRGTFPMPDPSSSSSILPHSHQFRKVNSRLRSH